MIVAFFPVGVVSVYIHNMFSMILPFSCIPVRVVSVYVYAP